MNTPESTAPRRDDGPATASELPDPEPTPLVPRTSAGVVSPVPDFEGEPDLSSPDLYLNRELTWLGFNYRVLHEAADDQAG